jgi:hypothetical protein
MIDNKDQDKVKKEMQNTQEDSFSSWLSDLEEKEQPEACSIDDPECEACGS